MVFLSIGAFSGVAEDWPHWTGPYSRNVSHETNLIAEFDRKTLHNVKWVTGLGDVAFGAPTVAEGRVFIGTNMATVRSDKRFKRQQGGVLVCCVWT